MVWLVVGVVYNLQPHITPKTNQNKVMCHMLLVSV